MLRLFKLLTTLRWSLLSLDILELKACRLESYPQLHVLMEGTPGISPYIYIFRSLNLPSAFPLSLFPYASE